MNNFNPSDLESAFISQIQSMGVSLTVYANRPKATTGTDDFVVVSLASPVTDLATYGECYLEVSLFAKDVKNVKNAKKLGFMYNKLITQMPARVGKYMVDTTPQVLADASDDYGFHARILNYKLTLKIL